MAVNTRIEYALRAILEIHGQQGSNISAQTICERQRLPKKYVEHLLNSLKLAGLINSSPGAHGGYKLAKPPTQISLYDVMNAVEDDTQMLDCAMEKHFCLGDGCGLMPVFHEVAEKQRDLFRSYDLDRIAALRRREDK